ncbi:cuticle protein 12.5 [Culex quinquefasciatus]|uniref:cuticle protein 12.5 n=1 Tax=Culex quinquefasciatus TaxID=7176 RepID=UPI0018E33F89|nr:cuticle protein 12.5 [Culex quinquefasciatus]
MFTKLFFIASLAIACASAKPGLVAPALAYSAPLVAGAPALAAYTAGYAGLAHVGDSAVVTSHNSQVINPAYAAYTAAAPFAYAASPALAGAPLAYTAASPYVAPYAAPYAAPLAAYASAPYVAAAPLAYSAPYVAAAPVLYK